MFTSYIFDTTQIRSGFFIDIFHSIFSRFSLYNKCYRFAKHCRLDLHFRYFLCFKEVCLSNAIKFRYYSSF